MCVEAGLTSVTHGHAVTRRRSPAPGLRTGVLVLFAVLFSLFPAGVVLGHHEDRRKILQTGAPLGVGKRSSAHQELAAAQGFRRRRGAAGRFGNTVKYAGTALLIVVLVDIPAGYGLAISGARVRDVRCLSAPWWSCSSRTSPSCLPSSLE